MAGNEQDGRFPDRSNTMCMHIPYPWQTLFLMMDRGFISPTGVFLYIDGMIRHPVTLSIRPYQVLRLYLRVLIRLRISPIPFMHPTLTFCTIVLSSSGTRKR